MSDVPDERRTAAAATERETRWAEATRQAVLAAQVYTLSIASGPLMALADAEVAAERQRLHDRIEALCYRDGYTTWDVDKHLPGNGWKPDDPKVIAWEAAHGHDLRLKCYPEFGCQLLIDPEDLLAALVSEASASPVSDDTGGTKP